MSKKFIVLSQVIVEWEMRYSPYGTDIFDSYWYQIEKLSNKDKVLCYLKGVKFASQELYEDIEKLENKLAKMMKGSKDYEDNDRMLQSKTNEFNSIKCKSFQMLRVMKVGNEGVSKKELNEISEREIYKFLIERFEKHINRQQYMKDELEKIAKVVAYSSKLAYGIVVPVRRAPSNPVESYDVEGRVGNLKMTNLEGILETANKYLKEKEDSSESDKSIKFKNIIGILEEHSR